MRVQYIIIKDILFDLNFVFSFQPETDYCTNRSPILFNYPKIKLSYKLPSLSFVNVNIYMVYFEDGFQYQSTVRA